MRQFFAYCEPNEPIYLCEERILTLQPNSSITQQTDSGYDDDNQPLESTLCSSWSGGQRYFSSWWSQNRQNPSPCWAPWSWAQCKCSRLGTSSLLKFGSFWVSLGPYTISDATKKISDPPIQITILLGIASDALHVFDNRKSVQTNLWRFWEIFEN